MLGGDKIALCNRFEIPTLPTDYSMVLDPTVECCACEGFIVGLSRIKPGVLTGLVVYYMDCDKTLQSWTPVTETDTLEICAVPGSIYKIGNDVFSITIFSNPVTCP